MIIFLKCKHEFSLFSIILAVFEGILELRILSNSNENKQSEMNNKYLMMICFLFWDLDNFLSYIGCNLGLIY